MYTMLLMILAGVIIGLVIMIKESFDYWWDSIANAIGNVILIVLQGVIGGGIVGMCIGCIVATPFAMETHLEKRQVTIENLQDGNSVHGSFFLGCGTVDGKMKYSYYTREGDLYELNQMDASKVKIRYTDGQPRIIWNKRVSDKDRWVNNWAIDWDHGETTDFVIEVPRGSIKSNFILDAQ